MTDGKIRAYTTRNGFPHDLVLCPCEGRDGSLWVGADFDGGLTRLKDGQFTHYTWRDGLLNAPLRALHEDRAGSLWVGTSKGLSCLRGGKFTRAPRRGTSPAGMSGHVEDHEGRLWFGRRTA